MASLWRAKLKLLDPQAATAALDDATIITDKEAKKRSVYEIALSYRAHTWLVPGVDIKELRALNKAMAPFIPGYLRMSFPSKKANVRRKLITGFAEKRLQMLESWLNELLHQVDVVVMEALQDVLQIPAEVLPWLKKMQRASHAGHTALPSTQMLFTDLHEAKKPKPDTPIDRIMDLRFDPAASHIAADAAAAEVERWLAAVAGPVAAVLYGPSFDMHALHSSSNPFAAAPTVLDSPATAADGVADGVADPGPDLSKPAVNIADLLDMCYRKFDRGIVDMSWRERSKALTVRRLMKRQSAMSLSGATPAAAAPRIADPVVDLAATLNYWKITNAAMNAKARFRDAYMTAPLFFEAAKGTSDRVGKGVHLLMANVQLQMCGIELMHLATSMNGSPAVTLGGWGMYERRVTQHGIFERPLADFDVVGQLLSRKKLPEFRCKPNTTRRLYLGQVGKTDRLKMDGAVWHYTLDAGWQKIWAKCFVGSDGLPKFTCFRDLDQHGVLGTLNLRECRPYFWTGIVATLSKPHGFAIFLESPNAPKPIPFYFAAATANEQADWITSIFVAQTKNYYYHENVPRTGPATPTRRPQLAGARTQAPPNRTRSQSLIMPAHPGSVATRSLSNSPAKQVGSIVVNPMLTLAGGGGAGATPVPPTRHSASFSARSTAMHAEKRAVLATSNPFAEAANPTSNPFAAMANPANPFAAAAAAAAAGGDVAATNPLNPFADAASLPAEHELKNLKNNPFL